MENKTGVFFAEQTAESCAAAIQAFEKLDAAEKFDAKKIAAHAKTFSRDRFIKEFKAACEETLAKIRG